MILAKIIHITLKKKLTHFTFTSLPWPHIKTIMLSPFNNTIIGYDIMILAKKNHIF